MQANGDARKVLMLAGADYVHSVVFRQVERLRKSDRYTFSAVGFGKPGGRLGHTDPGALFDRFEQWPGPAGHARTLHSVIQLVPHITTAVLAPRWPGESRNWKQRALDNAKSDVSSSKYRDLLEGYDLYHWHCFAPDRLAVLRKLRRNARVIITLWGTDLYRTAGIEEYIKQFEACQHATVFTMATPEMQATFLAKFGHQWAQRTRLLNYGACNLDKIDVVRQHSSNILKELGIPADRIVISVGNSAAPGNQHVAILNEIEKLNPELLRKIAVILPMTYAAEPAYLQEVREISHRLGTAVAIIDRFLSDEAISALRCSTDVAIHLPISDQFSASMCETLYAGAVLITGSWLPYSRLRSGNVVFHEIAGVPELAAKLSEVITNLPAERIRVQQNKQPVWDMISWESVAPKWLALYDEVLNS